MIEEHERRMEHALKLAFSQTRNASTADDYEVQVFRLKQMGKIIGTLTTMITKSSQHEVPEAHDATVASFGFLRANNDKVTVRKIVRIHRDPQAYEACDDWSLHMTDEEGEVCTSSHA